LETFGFLKKSQQAVGTKKICVVVQEHQQFQHHCMEFW
jgi:hypothetical protein